MARRLAQVCVFVVVYGEGVYWEQIGRVKDDQWLATVVFSGSRWKEVGTGIRMKSELISHASPLHFQTTYFPLGPIISKAIALFPSTFNLYLFLSIFITAAFK